MNLTQIIARLFQASPREGEPQSVTLWTLAVQLVAAAVSSYFSVSFAVSGTEPAPTIIATALATLFLVITGKGIMVTIRTPTGESSAVVSKTLINNVLNLPLVLECYCSNCKRVIRLDLWEESDGRCPLCGWDGRPSTGVADVPDDDSDCDEEPDDDTEGYNS